MAMVLTDQERHAELQVKLRELNRRVTEMFRQADARKREALADRLDAALEHQRELNESSATVAGASTRKDEDGSDAHETDASRRAHNPGTRSTECANAPPTTPATVPLSCSFCGDGFSPWDPERDGMHGSCAGQKERARLANAPPDALCVSCGAVVPLHIHAVTYLEDEHGPTGELACVYCAHRWQGVEPDTIEAAMRTGIAQSATR